MAITSYPFDEQDITEADYGALIGAAILTGVAGDPAGNDCKVTANGSNLQLTVTSVGGASTALIRGHAAIVTASETVTLAAAAASVRHDLVVLRMNYASNTVTVERITGTPGAGAPPAPVWGASNIYDLPLASVQVNANATSVNNGHVTDLRRFVGQSVGAWVESRRPSRGPAIGYNITAQRWEATLDGVTWSGLLTAATELNDLGGVLEVGRGGTGANTKLGARQNMEIFVQSSAPSHAAGRVWIQTP